MYAVNLEVKEAKNVRAVAPSLLMSLSKACLVAYSCRKSRSTLIDDPELDDWAEARKFQ